MKVPRSSTDHEFGSQDTDLKLSVVETYLRTYTRALTGKWPEIWYIDAFAGTGSRTVRVAARGGDLFDEAVPEQVEQRRGSAQIPLLGAHVHRARCCGAGNIRFTSDGQVFLGEPFDGFVHPASLLCRLICLLQASRSSGDV